MICQFWLISPDTSPIRSSISAAETELLRHVSFRFSWLLAMHLSLSYAFLAKVEGFSSSLLIVLQPSSAVYTTFEIDPGSR